MLVLSRKKSEQIRIDDEIVLTVISIHGNKAKIGIECPRSIPIRRVETWVDCVTADETVAGKQLQVAGLAALDANASQTEMRESP